MATLYSPDGRKYSTNDKAEITRLKTAHGYTERDDKPVARPTRTRRTFNSNA